jgi:uncharacterized OsmC-like protein
MNVDLRGTRIDIEKIMKAEPRRVGGINLTFYFPEGFVANEKERVVLERAAHTCPVICSIHPDIEVKTVFNWPVTVNS